MAADFAVLSCNGRMTSDPKTFDVGSTKKTVFSVAVNRYFKKRDAKDSDKPEKRTTYVDCVAWGPNSERVSKFGKKGAKVTMSGNWETDSYQKDGKEVKRDHLNITHLSIFTAPEDGDTGPDSKGDDEVPF